MHTSLQASNITYQQMSRDRAAIYHITAYTKSYLFIDQR
jgi:hypothetical protein